MGLCEVYVAGAGLCLVLLVVVLAISQSAQLNRSAVASYPVSRISTRHSLCKQAENHHSLSSRTPGSMEW